VLLEHTQPSGPFDLVLVDAPCSGTGTWRRQPELRWRLTPARLAELTALQDRLLDQAAGLAAPGGRLVQATCSILPAENQDRVAAALARHPELAAWTWGGTGLLTSPRAWPGISAPARPGRARTAFTAQGSAVNDAWVTGPKCRMV